MLAKMRPDVRTVHFTHTPFADPNVFRILPDAVAIELLGGMAAARVLRFPHRSVGGRPTGPAVPTFGIDPGRTFVSPLGVDADYLATQGRVDQAASAPAPGSTISWRGGAWCCGWTGWSLRRTSCAASGPSTSSCGAGPTCRGTVVMVALAYGSRQSLPEYQAYGTEAEYTAERVNDTWATDDWTPVILDVADDPDRSVAALTRYDVLLVNPVRDGLNLVAKEGPLVNERGRRAGAVEGGGIVRRPAGTRPRDQPLRCGRHRRSARPPPSTWTPANGPGAPHRCGRSWRGASPGTGWPTFLERPGVEGP